MKYLTLKSDVVIYTDSSKSAGVIDETQDAATGTVISARFLNLIEQSFLSDSPEGLSADAEKLLGDFMSSHSMIGLSDSKESMGSKEESLVEEGTTSVGNVTVQGPKEKRS